jgi:hypothetical protein
MYVLLINITDSITASCVRLLGEPQNMLSKSVGCGGDGVFSAAVKVRRAG